MRYAIYGVNRVTKDFMYIFAELEVVCLFEDELQEKEFLGKRVYPIEDIVKCRKFFDQLIICDFDKNEKIAKLQEIEKKENVCIPYLLEESFFNELNDEEINPKTKKIVVWGTGNRCRKMLETVDVECINFFIDSKKNINLFKGKMVKHPEQIENWNEVFVIVAVAQNREIIEFLEGKKLKENEDYCASSAYVSQASQMLRKTIFSKECYDLSCSTMLNHAEINLQGDIICCCSTFINNTLGNVDKKSVEEIWNSKIHKIMCLATENKTYSFCKKDMCPFFIEKNSAEGKLDLNQQYHHMTPYPEVVALGFDNTCNLSCITCRDYIQVSSGRELEKIFHYANVATKELVANCKFLIMAGNGEVLMSQGYRKVYTSDEIKEVPYIRLLSNGMLFNEKKWREFKAEKTGKIMLTASIDAATKDSYEKIRRGGKFDIIKRNMAFAGDLRKNGELAYFRMNFVVQKENYKEMPLFVEWAKEIGADEVFFTKILNWGTYTDEEFKEISMMEEDEITPKKELKEIMDLPIMQESIVDMGTIQFAHEPIPEKEIHNYYMWELERKVSDLFC